MKTIFIFYIFCFFQLCTFSSCKETMATHPFTYYVDIRLLNSDGSSVFTDNGQLLLDETRIVLLNPIYKEVRLEHIEYLKAADCVVVRFADSHIRDINQGNSEQEYIISIQYPEEIRNKTDNIKVKVKFNDGHPAIIEALYNDIKPITMGNGMTHFEIYNE